MAKQYEVELKWLKCRETEDFGEDEVLMVVLADDDPRRAFRKGGVSDGDTWTLGTELRAWDAVSVVLFDLDSGRHDHLGTVSLKLEPGSHTAQFRRGARYELRYEVRPMVRTIPVPATDVRIELVDVTCARTEDLTGRDHFFVAGGLLLGSVEAAVATNPTPINDTETNAFSFDRRLLYQGPLPENREPLHIGLVGFDDDASTDWARDEQGWRDLVRSITEQIDELGGTDSAQGIGDTVVDLVGRAISLDRPDVVGRLGLDIESSEIESHSQSGTRHWYLNLDGASYVVRLRVRGSSSAPVSQDRV